MTHLRIEQNNGVIEEVNSSVITKLYEIAHAGLDVSSNLLGRLHVAAAKEKHVTYLNTNFPDLYINADKQYVDFEDPVVLNVLSWYIGDGTGVSTGDMQRRLSQFGMEYTNPATNLNAQITSSSLNGIITFNELKDINCDSIAYWIFQNKTTLLSVRLPNTVTSLANELFAGCSSLQSINLDNITSMGVNCFTNCSLLDNITLNSNLTTIPQLCFDTCSSITLIDLSNVTIIGNLAFNNCTNLESVTSIQNVTSIGYDAFYKCKNILEFETLNLPNLNDLSIYGEGAFCLCTQIKHITDLGTIPSIGAVWNGIFSGCTNLEDVVLPETVTTIGYNGFSGCSKLKYIKLLSTQVPTYTLVNGHGYSLTYGRFFGESYTNNDPVNNAYNGLTFPIYVKDNLLSQYQTADGWKYVGPNRLRPLSLFATDFPNG